MTRKIWRTGAAAAIVQVLLVGRLFAADLVWTGAADGKWGSGVNWTNSVGAAVSFVANDNVLFDNSAAQRWIDLSATLTVGDIRFDHAGDYSVTNASGGKISSAKSFVKRGSGTLYLRSTGHAYTNDVRIEGGEIVTTLPNGGGDSPLGRTSVKRQIYVGDGAALRFLQRNTMGGGDTASAQAEIFVDQGGIFSISGGVNTVGSLTLNGGAFTFHNGLSGDWGVFKVCQRMTFTGSMPYVLETNAYANCFINLNHSPKTTFHVENITGDTAPDVTFKLPFKNTLNQPASGWIKTGGGTMEIISRYSNFSGDVEIREGTVVLNSPDWGGNTDYSPLGNPLIDRRISVFTNAVLQLKMRNSLSGATATNQLKAEIEIDHGTLLLGDVAAVKGVNTIGSLTLRNGTLNYTNMYNDAYGFLKICQRFRLAGTVPYVFEGSSDSGCFMILNASPTVVFDVEEITGDASPDATFGFPLKNQQVYSAGLIKDGAGAMRMTAVSTYTGDTIISNGVLRVDGGLASSGVIVNSGGWLGGTGSVQNVTVAVGGGFDVKQGQEKPLAIGGSLTLEGAGVVRIQNPESLPGSAIRVVLAEVAGGITGGENADLWAVEVEGVAPSVNYRLRVVGSQLVAGFAPKGTFLKVQ